MIVTQFKNVELKELTVVAVTKSNKALKKNCLMSLIRLAFYFVGKYT